MKLHGLFQLLLLLHTTLSVASCSSIPPEEIVREKVITVTVPSVCPPCPEVNETNDADRELASIIRDISHYAAMSSEEQQEARSALSAKLDDKFAANHSDLIRLASLLSLRGNLQNDQRALDLLSAVRKSKEASEDLRQLAATFSRLLSVRVREMQKLQALNKMEKKLLQEKFGSPN